MKMSPGKWHRVPSSPVFHNDTELELTLVIGTELSIDCQPRSLLNKQKEHYHTSVLYYGTIF